MVSQKDREKHIPEDMTLFSQALGGWMKKGEHFSPDLIRSWFWLSTLLAFGDSYSR